MTLDQPAPIDNHEELLDALARIETQLKLQNVNRLNRTILGTFVGVLLAFALIAVVSQSTDWGARHVFVPIKVQLDSNQTNDILGP